jgi:hypothetical protein
MIGRVLFIALLCLSASAVFPQTPEVDNWCRAGSFTRESNAFQIYTTTGKPKDRAYFYNDFEDDCPGNERCRSKAYVVPGDRLVVSRTFGNFGCAWFAPAKGLPTVGWIKLSNLRSYPFPEPRVSAWLGEWRYAENSIKFTNNKLAGYLNVTGDALWRGVGDNVHIGEIDDRAMPDGNVLKIGENDTDEFACKVTMRLIDEFLVVIDNLKCGGANVSFSGVYRRTRRY